MKKSYWIVRSDITDLEQFKRYTEATPKALGEFGGRFLVRGGESVVVEGTARSRHAIIEFPSYQAAKACWESDTYQSAKQLRLGAAEMDIVIIEGVEPVDH